MIADLKSKRKYNPWKGLLILAGGIIIFIILCLLVLDSVKIYKKRMELASQIQNLENKMQDIKNKNEELQQGALQVNDNQYIEKVAREELDLQKPGEKVFSFIMPQTENEGGDTAKNKLQHWLGSFLNWLKYFF